MFGFFRSTKPKEEKEPRIRLRPVYGSNLNKMRAAQHLLPNEEIIFGFQFFLNDKTEYAFTNMGLLWRTKRMPRHEFHRVDYATNTFSDFKMTKIGDPRLRTPISDADVWTFFQFRMGTQQFEICVWRQPLDLISTIKYIRVLQAVQREQLKQQSLREFIHQLGSGAPVLEQRQCYKQVMLDAMESFGMKPPVEATIDKEGHLLTRPVTRAEIILREEPWRVKYSHQVGVYIYDDFQQA